MTTNDFLYNDLWNRVQKEIAATQIIEEGVLNDIYHHSKIVEMSENEILISSEYYVSFSIMKDHREMLELCFESLLGKRIPVALVYDEGFQNIPKNPSIINEFIKNYVDPNYVFSNFVVGRSNSLAHNASMTVASNLGLVYNPLFIYGNSGLGKTHLLCSIGNYVLDHFKTRKVGYISTLDFVEGVAKSIKDNTIDKFKETFNELDLLLVDDIQFLANKDKSLEIFFTIFNNLVNNKKQIVVSADRSPSDIKGLQDRIISRFNQGLTVSIEAPEYETSVNILKQKLSNNVSATQQVFDDDVISFIATNFSQDVRTLEGAINRLLFYSVQYPTYDNRIDIKLCTDAFKDQILENRNEMSIIAIRKVVCDYYNLTKQQIISKSRVKKITDARHIAMYLCRKKLDAPYEDIGMEFGKRDHSTVMSACKKVESLIKTDPLYLKAINEIEVHI